jgi:hypothetical protein
MRPRVGDIFEDVDPRQKGRRIRCERAGDARSLFVNVSSYTGRRLYISNDRLVATGSRGYRYICRDVSREEAGEK